MAGSSRNLPDEIDEISAAPSDAFFLQFLPRTATSLIVVLFLGTGIAAGQSGGRTSETDFRSWYMYFGDHPMGDRGLGFHFDAQLRVNGLGASRNQTLLRPGLNFDLNDSVQFSGGYAYIDTSAGKDAAPGFDVPESRL